MIFMKDFLEKKTQDKLWKSNLACDFYFWPRSTLVLNILTIFELFWLFRCNPVPSLDIHQLEIGKKLADQRDHLVRDVLAQCSAYEKGRFQEAHLGRILEWEVTEIVEGFPKYFNWNTEFVGSCWPLGW